MDKSATLIMGGDLSMVQAPHNPSSSWSEGCEVRTSVIDLRGKRNHPLYDPSLNADVVYVGRRQWWGAGRLLDAHPLGNPFGVGKYGLHESLVKYADWMLADQRRIELARSLRGRVLGCWCLSTQPACHGLVVAAVADDDLGRIAAVLELAQGSKSQ